MANSSKESLEEYLLRIPAEYTEMFRVLAQTAISLGYSPKRCKTADLCIDFRSSRTKRTIMKFSLKEEKHDGFKYGERDVPGLRMRFFAADDYSELFCRSVQYAIEDRDGKYTGCYGCGRCKGAPKGYRYTYPDGKKVFRCGTELISIFNFTGDDLPEMLRLLKVQARWDMETAKG